MPPDVTGWDDPETLFDTPALTRLTALAHILKGANTRPWGATRDEIADFIRADREAEAATAPLAPATTHLATLTIEVAQWHAERQTTGRDLMGHSTDLARLDALLGGLDRGRLTVLLAAPGAGKTTWSNQLAAAVAKTGAPVLFVSFENTVPDLILKQVARLAGQSASDIRRGRVAPATLAEAYAVFAERAGQHLYYVAGGGGTTVETIRGAVAQLCRAYPGMFPLVVVDFLQRLATTTEVAGRGAGLDDMRGRVGLIAQQLRGLANETGCHIWAISSTNRQAYDGAKATPGLASARESGDIEFAADAVLTLAADTAAGAAGFSATTDPFTLGVVKNRHGDTGTIALMRDRTTLRLVEADLTTSAQPGQTARVRAGWSAAAS